MTPNELKEWRETVTKLNIVADELVASRKEVYEVVANELKAVFKDYAPKVYVNGDGSFARVTFKQGQKVLITPEMGLNYPFEIDYELDEYANWVTVLKFNLLDE